MGPKRRRSHCQVPLSMALSRQSPPMSHSGHIRATKRCSIAPLLSVTGRSHSTTSSVSAGPSRPDRPVPHSGWHDCGSMYYPPRGFHTPPGKAVADSCQSRSLPLLLTTASLVRASRRRMGIPLSVGNPRTAQPETPAPRTYRHLSLIPS